MAAIATRVIPLLMLLFSLRPVLAYDIYLSLQQEGNYTRRGENATFLCLHNSTSTVNINGTNYYVGLYELNNTIGDFQLLEQQERDDFTSETIFSFLDVDVDDEGTYKCIMNSSNILHSNEVNLTIAYLENPNLTASRHYLLIDETVSFTCSKPSGNPPPNDYSWFKDGSPWVRPKSNGEIRLQIKSVHDSGSYKCRAESVKYAGSNGMFSNQVNVQVLEVASSDTEANEGDRSVVLMCEINPNIDGITGSKWEKIASTTAIDIQDNTNKYVATQYMGKYNLTINTVNRSDSGIYRCHFVRHDVEGLDNFTANVQLIVNYIDPPNVQSAIKGGLKRGQSANITCVTSYAKPPVNFVTWLRNGQPIIPADSSATYDVSEDGRTLTFRSFTEAETGVYSCRAESRAFNGSSAKNSSNSIQVDLIYIDPPVVHSEIKDGLKRGQSASIMCVTSGADPPVDSVTWFRDDQLIITADGSVQYEVSEDGRLLTFLSFTEAETGVYSCRAESRAFNGSSAKNSSNSIQVDLIYIDPPVVHSEIKDGLKRGQSASIMCVTSGADPPVDSVTWFRDDQLIITADGSVQYEVSEDDRLLTFLSFTEAETGVYSCRAESKAFQGTSGIKSFNSSQVDLIFLDEPQIKVSSNKIYIGETVELTCILPDGNPPPNEVIWLKDGQQIDNKTINKDNRGDNKEVTLKIQTVNTESNGEYSCRVLSEAYKHQGGLESNVTQTISVVEKQDVEDEPLNIYLIIAVSIAVVVLITVIILVYICCFKPMHLVVLEQQITDAKESLIVECNYRPRLARADSVQWVTPNGSLPLMRFPSCFNTLAERKYLKEIPSDDKIELQAKNIDRMKVASNGRGTLYLEINGVTAFDSGEYTCIVCRRNGKKTTTHSGIITVHSTLIVAVGEAFSNNDSLTISCMCLPFNEPVDSFIWFLADETGEVQQGHGSALASSTDLRSRGRYSCAREANTCYLRIGEPTDEDGRNYQCKVIRKYDNIPFQGVIVLTKDRHTLEWKMSQFVPQGLPQEAKSTDTLTSGEPLLSKDTMRTDDIEVVRMNSYEVTDESIQTAKGAINGGDKFVVEDGENIIDNNQCNNDIEAKPNMIEQSYNTNGGENGGNDDDGDDGRGGGCNIGGGGDCRVDNADHDDVAPTETERHVCKNSDVQLAHSDQETSEQGNAKIDTKDNIKANGYDISTDIDEQLILQGDSEEFTGNNNQGLEAQTENSHSNGDSSAQCIEKTQDNVEMEVPVHENGDVDKWLDLEVNSETAAHDEVHDDNTIKIEHSNFQINTEKDVGNSEDDVKKSENSNLTE